MDKSLNLEEELFQPLNENERLAITAGKATQTVQSTVGYTTPSTIDYDAVVDYDWNSGN